MFLRRLGQNNDALCQNGHSCPQVLEEGGGDFVVIGEDVTSEALPALPAGPGIGPKERAVRVPRQVMVIARAEIPAA
jgi:hypothetical protein